MRILSKVSGNILEEIYEYTYKYQMLMREQAIGDYGTPTILPDPAYIELSRISGVLVRLLDSVASEIITEYDDWIGHHDPDESGFIDLAYELFNEIKYEFKNNPDLQTLITRGFTEEEVKGIGAALLEDIGLDPFYDELINYLYPKTAQEEQAEFPFLSDPTFEWTEKPEELMEITDVWQLPLEKIQYLLDQNVESWETKFISNLEQSSKFSDWVEEMAVQEKESYYENTALGTVIEVRDELVDEWDSSDLGNKIILFQKALTTVHNNGEMAEYILDDIRAVEILDDLSAGENVSQWDRDLEKKLGYPPGSRLVFENKWYTPAHVALGFARLAEMKRDDLEAIYELTYKYGWILSKEREEGWLPDRAYMEKARIESQLEPLMNYGLEEIQHTYYDWLSSHTREGWTEMCLGTGDIDDILSTFKRWTNIGHVVFSDVEDAIGKYWYDTNIGNQTVYVDQEDIDALIDVFGEQYAESKEVDLDEVTPEKYVKDNDLEEDLKQWIIANTDHGTAEDIMDTIGIAYTKEQLSVSDLAHLLSSYLYPLYLANFYGLEDEIEGIQETQTILQQAEGARLNDKILAFQLGLTTVHHSGVMAEHLLETRPGEGERILDELSSGPKVKQWDMELEKIFGYTPQAPVLPERTYYEPELERHMSLDKSSIMDPV